MAEKVLVNMRGITKTFYDIKANDDVDFDLKAGEVHALLGENGAGKSTLMSILCGLYQPDEGTIELEGCEVVFRSPKDAIAQGIGIVHQHFMLVPSLTVWENMILGSAERDFIVKENATCARIRELSARYGLDVDPLSPVWQLSIGEQQRVAILRMLFHKAKILILDEPTSVLTPQETEKLFETVKHMKEEGFGIVFISHKLKEVFEISDRITVLRRGRVVGTLPAREVTAEKLAEMMVGSGGVGEIKVGVSRKPPGKPILIAEEIRVRNDKGLVAVDGVSLTLRENQILGIAGVSGNGQGELAEALAGMRHIERGRLYFTVEDVTSASARRMVDLGVKYIPADRKGVGLVPNMNVAENVALRKYWRPPYRRGFFIDWDEVYRDSGYLIESYDILTPGIDVAVRMLSGGNQQKLILARELSDNMKVVIAMHPTWGLDVKATAFVREKLLAAKEEGGAVLLISEDLDELLMLSDLLAVMYRGRLMGTIEAPDRSYIEKIGLMMAGIASDGQGGKKEHD
jgi:simple sugar transport system ATP-binding protein